MDIIRLSPLDAHSPLMDGLMAIYATSLPASEQKPRDMLEDMLVSPDYYFYILRCHNQIAGFAILYAPAGADYCLLEYMAIDETHRNHGLGGKLFDFLAETFANRHMIMEIDSPYQPSADQPLRRKRLAFYRRHGGRLVKGLAYILPLEAGEATPPDMLLMLRSNRYRQSVPKERLAAWITDIYTAVYGRSKDDGRIAAMMASLPEDLPLTATA